ncbi:HLH-domain-containing protein [Artomyces pyxidatus]|uniref:HLH-domain-containing protein n=1 Tax=Artomyces pyxidatus TaxID=48021 RepID=A0ACB8T2W6_9AGAM|nr:HLH-domain-containing protein [Artomyces pyxidatus]
MSSFFPASSYKPQIRQEGFHLPSPTPPPQQQQFDANGLFGGFALPDPFRKSQPGSMDFSDELASLMAHSPAPPHHQSHERSTHSPDTQEPQQYRHNIFDISAPATYPTNTSNNTQQYALQPHLPPFHDPYGTPNTNNGAPPSPHASHPPPHFNSTLPALSSSLRFDPREPHPPPSSFPGPRSPSRSRSRDVHGTTHGGPVRPKRGSVSSTSPPRHTILIPHRPPLALHTHAGSAWAQEFSLPTPDSLGGGFAGSYGPSTSPKELDVQQQVNGNQTNGMDAAAKQAALANEKRRRRRESHNAVERRRRDNINEKISELATLIPECLLDPTAPVPTPTSPTPDDPLFAGIASPKDEDTVSASAKADDAVVKANKGMILRKSVEYIRYLQQLVSAQATRNRELEAQLSTLRSPSSSLTSDSPPYPPAALSSSTKWDLEEVSEGDDMEMDGSVGDEGERGRGRERRRAGADGVRVKEEGMEVS